MSRHKPHLDPATGAPRHPLPDTSAAQPPAAPVEPSDGAIYAAISKRDITPEERRLIEKSILDSSAVLYPLEPVQRSSAATVELRWQTASEKECCDTLYQIGGALRRVGKFDLAQDAEKIANTLYPGKIKPAPIVPRTTT